jgi:ComF family protein
MAKKWGYEPGGMLRHLIRTFKHAIFPVRCLACGEFFHLPPDRISAGGRVGDPSPDPLENEFHRVMEPFFCPDCIRNFSPIRPPFCTRCGRMFITDASDDHECGACIRDPGPCLSIRSAGLYDGALKSAVHALKYGHKTQLARPLGTLLFAGFRQFFDWDAVDCIIPIPLHRSRIRERGFNQAALLVRHWPTLIRADRENRGPDFDEKNLVRNRKTLSQTGLGREKRRQNVKNAFSVTRPEKISGKQILLVDDVFTTGSTSRECAKTLLAAGAGAVRVLTLARAE